MKKSLILLSIVILFSCKTRQLKDSYTSTNFDLIQLTEGVYACIHKPGGKAICNIGIIDNGNETIIFDSFLSPEAAQEIPKIVNQHNLSPIKYVINSHYHNDHIRGNQVFGDDVEIISTTRTAELITEREPLEIAEEKKYAPLRKAYYDSLYQTYKGDQTDVEYQKILMWRSYYEVLEVSYKEVVTRLPERMIEEELYLNGPERKVFLWTRGQGHTDSDLILYLPDDDILFTGDLVFNRCHPYLAHGSLYEWKEWLSHLYDLKPSTVIPGHGNAGDASTILAMKSYIEDIERVAAQIDNEKQITTDLIPLKYADWWFDRFFPVNLTFAYEKSQNPNSN